MRTVSSISALVVLALVAGCAGADGDPLGGAHGGTTSGNPGASEDGNGGGSTGTQGVGDGDGSDAGPSATGTGGSSGGSGGSSSGGSSSGSAVDAGSSATSGGGSSGGGSSGGGTGAASAPTWTTIYTSYLATGTIGNCAKSGCHSQMKSASAAYTWLKSKGQINGTASSEIADPNQSILSWMGGNMPKGGPSSNAAATSDIEAWAAAGAAND